MTIKVAKVGENKYTAEASPPHASSVRKTPAPLQLRQLIAELKALGCHPTDIGDALYTVDKDWVNHLDA